jgi:hypothetical protein
MPQPNLFEQDLTTPPEFDIQAVSEHIASHVRPGGEEAAERREAEIIAARDGEDLGAPYRRLRALPTVEPPKPVVEAEEELPVIDDPTYHHSPEWQETREQLRQARNKHRLPKTQHDDPSPRPRNNRGITTTYLQQRAGGRRSVYGERNPY